MVAALHAGFIALLIVLHHAPKPRLYVDIVGDGKATITSEPDGIRCGDDCRTEADKGTRIALHLLLEEGSQLESWEGCDPSVTWSEECVVVLDGTTHVIVDVSPKPSEEEEEQARLAAEAELLAHPAEISLIAPGVDVPRMRVPLPPPEEKKKPLLPELAMVEPVPPPTPQLLPPPPPEAPPVPKKPAPPQPPPEMKAVEVPDQNKVDQAPDDARFLSDKNRDVAEETRATDTNLEVQRDGKAVASEESSRKDDQVGADEEKIAQMDDVDPTSIDAKRVMETETRGSSKTGEVPRGQAGDEGQAGQHGDGSTSDKPGVLAMRGIEGRGVPGGPQIPEERRDQAPGRVGEQGRAGRRGIKTQLSYDDYKRIVGTQVADQEVEMGRKRQSKRIGRFEKKQAAVRAALENFVPEVRPGNQTALKTRAAPFALYIARMHRRIHELWGFGFLDELNSRPSDDPMNNPKLETIIEVAVNPDGTIHKTTIVEPSGLLQYDVAAIDTLLTAGPYEETPPEIRSVDGRVYLHWVFRRDWEQCGTFNVRMYILDHVSEGKIDDGEMVRNMRGGATGKRPAGAGGGGSTAGGDGATAKDGGGGGDPAASARAQANMPAPDDPRAEFAANLWVTGFAYGDLSKMIKASTVPFSSGGQVVANAPGDLTAVYRSVLAESRGGIREWKLLSAAGYRKRFGTLPPGEVTGTDSLFLVVRVGSDRFTLVMKRQSDGEYRAVAFHR